MTQPDHVKIIPYSDHSSFSELRTFVELLQPRSVRPVVLDFTGEKALIRATRTNMAVFNDLLDTDPPFRYSIPVAMVELLTGNNFESFTAGFHHTASRPRNKKVVPKTLLHSISTGPRRRARGVQYLSPSKPAKAEGVQCGMSPSKKRRASDGGADIEECLSDESPEYRAENPFLDGFGVASIPSPSPPGPSSTGFIVPPPPSAAAPCTLVSPRKEVCASSSTHLVRQVATPPSTDPVGQVVHSHGRDLVRSNRVAPHLAWCRQETSTCARAIPIGQLRSRGQCRSAKERALLLNVERRTRTPDYCKEANCEENSNLPLNESGAQKCDSLLVPPENGLPVTPGRGERSKGSVLEGVVNKIVAMQHKLLSSKSCNMTPLSSHVTPLNSHVTNHVTPLRSHVTHHVTPLRSHVTPLSSNGTPLSSHVTNHVTSPISHVTSTAQAQECVAIHGGNNRDVRFYPDMSQIVGYHGYSKEQLRQHARECSCLLCNAELAIFCIRSHNIVGCFCDRCAWGIKRFFTSKLHERQI